MQYGLLKEDFYQWDTGQRVMLSPEGGEEITELHMHNDSIGGPALSIEVQKDEEGMLYANIPDVLFQRPGRIRFWSVISDRDSTYTTEEHNGINVIPRPKPTDYAYTDPDVLSYKELLEKVNAMDDAVAAAKKVVEDADNGVFDGKDGKDGFSPIVTIEENEFETTVTIEDQEGEKSFAIPKSAEQIIFPNAVKTAYPVGNITLTNGVGVMADAGDSLADLFRNVWFKVMQPTIIQPSLSVSFSCVAKEVGTTIQPAYYATFGGGKYSFGPATGVTATEWRISDTEGYTAADPMGTTEVLLGDNTAYQLTVECDHSAGAVPLDNEGNEATVSGIEAGTLTWKSSVVKGYRNSFYGALSAADVASWEQYITAGTLTLSDCIRSLTKSGKALQSGSSFTVTIPAGTKQVVIAYPATLKEVSSIKDVNSAYFDIKSSFELSTVDVEGANGYAAIPYKVYVLLYSVAVSTANTYEVVI